MEGLERIIREHPFFKDLDPKFVALVVGCARNVRFEAGEYLFREGDQADQFYLVRHGRVALEMVSPSGGVRSREKVIWRWPNISDRILEDVG